MANNPGDRAWERFSELSTAFNTFVNLTEIVRASANEMTEFEFVEGWSPRRIYDLCQLARMLDDHMNGFENEINAFRSQLADPDFADDLALDQMSAGILTLTDYNLKLQTVCERERTAIAHQRFEQFQTLIRQLDDLKQQFILACHLASDSQASAARRLIAQMEAYQEQSQQVADRFRVVIPQVPMTAEDTRQLYDSLRQAITTIQAFLDSFLDNLE